MIGATGHSSGHNHNNKHKSQAGLRRLGAGLLLGLAMLLSEAAYGLAANKVWFKVLAPGRYRVYVNVTIPELKQFREYHIDFRSYRQASEFFWELVNGADFYPPSKNRNRFSKKPEGYKPW